MENTNIIREPTAEERRDFTPLTGGSKSKTSNEVFEEQLAGAEQKAIKEGKPFAAKVARDDFNDMIQDQVKKSVRKNGFIEWSEIRMPKMDWSKYSDLKNFELVDEGEKADEHLTKTNPGLQVMIKYKKYKFEGYSNTYTVMEDGAAAIARAKKKNKDN